MRVLVDCTQITQTKAGVGVYAINMLRHLVAIEPTTHYVLLVQDDDPDVRISAPNVTFITVAAKWFRKLPVRFLLEQIAIPWICRRHRIDVLHSLHYSFPLLPMRAKKVVTIHDLTMLLMPEVHEAIKVRYFCLFIRLCSRRADTLLFVSESTQADYNRLFPDSIAHECVTPLGKGEQFYRQLDPAQLSRVADHYHLQPPFILNIGTIEPRKNIERLIQAFAIVRERVPEAQLVMAGKVGWACDHLPALVQRLQLQDSVRFLGFIPEEDKPLLLAAATVFAYPSLYEGFGIPLLEAMACGTPSLSSNTSSLKEVGGNGALLIDPTSVSKMAEALTQLLTDPTLRKTLSEEGLAQAAHFTWHRTATTTWNAYQATASAPPPS